MDDNNKNNHILEGISLTKQILSTSLSMIGFSTTLIGLIKVAESNIGPSHVDEYCAIVLQFFLVSAAISYWSLRCKSKKLSVTLQLIADRLLMIGLVSISLIAVFFAYNFI